MPLIPQRKEFFIMNKTVKKQFWFSPDDALDLRKKACQTCLSEAALVRLLIKGYEPKERPDERFYNLMREISVIGNNINQILLKVRNEKNVDLSELSKEVERWHKFQSRIEQEFLRPSKRDIKWQ